MKSELVIPIRRLKHFQVGDILIQLGTKYKVIEKSIANGIVIRSESYSTAGKHTYANFKGTILNYGLNCQMWVQVI